jgi:UDP-N-acetylmuramate--alanine ligase
MKLVIYSEAIPNTQQELKRALELGIKTQKYNEALASIANDKKLVAITGTHGKSTTTSLVSLILKNSGENFYSVVGTLLKEFGGKNFFSRTSEEKDSYFAIEACEYKEHFLLYSPLILVITNIDFDHADYFKTPERYYTAFEKMIGRVLPGGFVIFTAEDENMRKLVGLRKDIEYVALSQSEYLYQNQIYSFPEISMQVPGDHILLDAKLAYVVAHMIGIPDEIIIKTLSAYSGVWRRMEIIGETRHKNILMSDYGHHPTEISVTLRALKQGYTEKKLFVIFQPHQYSRTLELLEGFQNCFSDADTLIIPDIYESRDSEEDKKKIDSSRLVNVIHHPSVHDGK